MRVLEFQPTNFGPHADRTFVFGPGLNVIVGPNGVGKSTLVDGMMAAITGDFVGTKDENIRQGTGKKERSQVRMLFEHAGTRAEVVRSLQPNSRSLVIGGDKKGRTEGEVNEALWRFLGVSKAVIADYAFVRQWETFAVLSATPSRRLEVLNRLFRVDQVAKLHQHVSDRLSSLNTFVSDATPTRLSEAKGRLNEAVKRRRDVEHRLALLRPADECERLISDYRAASAYRDEEARRRMDLTRVSQAVDETAQAKAHAEQEYAVAAAAVEEVAAAMRDLAEDAGRAEAVMREWKKYGEDLRYHQRLVAEQTERRSRRDLLGPRPGAIDETVLLADEGQLREMDARLQFLQTFLKAHAHVANGVCPTCNQPTTADLKADYLRKQVEVRDIEANRPVLVGRITRGRQSHKFLDDWQRKWDGLSAGITDLPPEPTVPTVSHENAQVILQAVADLSADHKNKLAVLSSLGFARERATAAAAKAAANMRKLQALPPVSPVSHPPSDADYQSAVVDQASRGATENERAGVLREIAVASASVDELTRLLDEGRANANRARHLDKLKQVFLPSALTARVVDRCLASLSHGMNAKLMEFGDPFRVKVSANASFDVTFPDGHMVPATRLSGGEKMILALSFRLSVLEAFGGELGFLCLDEPTVGLDIDNRGSLSRCLAAAGRAAREAGGQILIVTHDRQLAHSADSVVDLVA